MFLERRINSLSIRANLLIWYQYEQLQPFVLGINIIYVTVDGFTTEYLMPLRPPLKEAAVFSKSSPK